MQIYSLAPGLKNPEEIAEALVSAGRWHLNPDGSFQVHDYLDYNPSREKVLAERESGKKRAAASYSKRVNSSGEETAKNRRTFGNSSGDTESESLKTLKATATARANGADRLPLTDSDLSSLLGTPDGWTLDEIREAIREVQERVNPPTSLRAAYLASRKDGRPSILDHARERLKSQLLAERPRREWVAPEDQRVSLPKAKPL